MTTYTDEQRDSHYEWLVDSIQRLRKGGITTEEDIEYFTMLRNTIHDFDSVNLEVQDVRFRRKAFEAEQMARYLRMYMDDRGMLEPSTYVQLLERCRYLRDYLFTPDELANHMANLRC